MMNVEIITLDKVAIIISKINGNVSTIPNELLQDNQKLEEYLNEIDFFKELPSIGLFDKKSIRTVFISLHAFSKCNLNCTYCFKKDRDNNNLSFDDAKKFIDMMIDEYPNAGKYIVDPTGSGEPLLKMELLLQIAEYCNNKTNELKKEVLPMLVTNGTLLTKDKVEQLQSIGYIFGISIDGDKKDNDFYRQDYNGNGIYKTLIKNIKGIKHKQYLGAAVTLTNNNLNMIKTMKHLIRYFTTISIKPVRSTDGSTGLNENNLLEYKKAYSRLLDFLLDETNKGNLEYIAALLNGDDYFGKFILRSILNQKVSTRCDAGIGRFSLAPDHKIYVCPGAIDIKELEIGSLEGGLDLVKRDKFFNLLTNRSKCGNCFARFVCGGECMVNSYYTTKTIDDKDDIMCELKKHLYKLALIYNHVLQQTSYYSSVYNACIEKVNRFDENKEVSNYLKTHPNITYMDVKMNQEKYLK